MQYKRLCKVLNDKGYSFEVSNNRIKFKVKHATFEIVYCTSINGELKYYDLYNNCHIHSRTYMNYKELKSLLLSSF